MFGVTLTFIIKILKCLINPLKRLLEIVTKDKEVTNFYLFVYCIA